MAETSLVENSQAAFNGSTSGNCSSSTKDPLNGIESSRIENKIDFFRFMGLEIRTANDTDGFPTNASDKNNNDIRKVFPLRAQRSPRQSDATKSCGLTDDSLGIPSNSTNKREGIKKTDTFGSRSIIGSLKECSVAIIGEKCRVCGQSFKCIKDLQHHVRKKHKRRKPKTKVLLLKIGDEVIARMPIRRKYLKRIGKRENDLATISNNDDKEIAEETSWNGKILQKNRYDEIRFAEPFVVLKDIRDVAEKRANLQSINKVPSSTPSHSSNASTNSYADEEQDVREVLRIRRSPFVGASINHETPNRIERELLLSDAIREFDRIAMDHSVAITDFVDDEKTMRDQCNDVVDDFCWLADNHSSSSHLDLVENNYSYNIRNNWDVDAPLEFRTPMATHLNPVYFNQEDSCSPREENHEDDYNIPDFIDYSECLNSRVSFNKNNDTNNNNNNSIYGSDSPFFEKTRTSDWNSLAQTPIAFNCDIQREADAQVDLSVLIKEEIMLDDLL